MRTLIVDHHILHRERLVSLIHNINNIHVIGEAESCSEALSKARVLKPDLILSEIMLPDGSCLEAMKELFSISPGVRIVILTTYESEEFLLRAIQNGARGYLVKDEWFETMLSALYKLNQDEFIVSPKMAQVALTDYSRVRAAFDRQFNIEPLTARERDVLQLLCLGSSNREIARDLVISENTVRVHLQSIYKKLKLKKRREAREKYQAFFNHNHSSGDLLPDSSLNRKYLDLEE